MSVFNGTQYFWVNRVLFYYKGKKQYKIRVVGYDDTIRRGYITCDIGAFSLVNVDGPNKLVFKCEIHFYRNRHGTS